MESLDKSVELLEKTIKELHNESIRYYDVGDNYRGNIRNDAARRLEFDLERLKVAQAYITKALKK